MGNVNFIACQKHDVEKLQMISKNTYEQAFNHILGEDNVNEYVKVTYSMQNLTRELDQLNTFFLFIEVNGFTIGYGKYSIYPICLKIERIYILDSYKGLGAGSKFMHYVENIAQKRKIDLLCIEVLAQNKKAKNIYEYKGFRVAAKQTIMIGKKECHLLSMEKKMSDR